MWQQTLEEHLNAAIPHTTIRAVIVALLIPRAVTVAFIDSYRFSRWQQRCDPMGSETTPCKEKYTKTDRNVFSGSQR